MAQAKRKNITKPSHLPAHLTGSQLYKQALPRMEQTITTLATCFVAEGWHESWQSGGAMPALAADVMTYFRARAGGARENAAEEAKVNVFVAHCGQSLDWIFGGDPRGMICKAAGNSPQAASLQSIARSSKVQEIASDISELESPVRDACNLAMACRMLASSRSLSIVYFFAFSPSSTSLRMASERLVPSSTDLASIAASMVSGRRMCTPGSRPPVGGRPRFFDATLIDFFIIAVLP